MKHLPTILFLLALGGLGFFAYRKWWPKAKNETSPLKKYGKPIDKSVGDNLGGGGSAPREGQINTELTVNGLKQIVPGQLELYFNVPNSTVLAANDNVKISGSQKYDGTFKVLSAKSANGQTTSVVINYPNSYVFGYTDYNATGKLQKL